LLCVLLALGSVTGPAGAQTSSPIPEFTGESVYVVGVPDQYGPLREDVKRLERTSPQKYYVVVLRTAGPGRNATRSYLTATVEAWESQARHKQIPFDTRRAVIIILAIENRQIIVLGGEELQERFGFRDPYIERDLLQPHFFAYAKSGDYLRGLRVLVGQIDRWIAARDTELVRRREEAAARDARLKGDAESTLADTKRLLDETRKELVARKSAGLVVEGLEERVRQASEDLDAAGSRIGSSAGEALQLAQQAQHDLQGVVDQLRQVSARQARLDDRLRKVTDLSGEVLKAVEQAGRDGLPAAAVQAQLDEANKTIEAAGKAIPTDPDQAEDLLGKADRGLRDALDHARRLPELRLEVERKAKAVAPLEQAASAAFDRARRGGVALGGLQKDIESARSLLSTARARAGEDDRKALADFTAAEALLTGVSREARARLDRHFTYTRVIPSIVFGIFGLLTLGVVGLLWLRKRHLQDTVGQQFKGFRERAVSLMDRLDALRQRHKTLPATDPDFTQPLAGATLALYNEVEADLNGLWDRWLKVMEVWDKAQKLVNSGSALAVKETEEAKRLLEKEGNFEEILRQAESCKERLDRLNQVHESARDGLKVGRDKLASLRNTLGTLTAAGLPIEPYQKDVATVETLFNEAEGLTTADPIGASEVIARTGQALAVVAERSGQVLARSKDAESTLAAIGEVAARAAELRSGGLRLTEDEADPDPRLEEARRHHAAALAALRKADPAEAGREVDQARSITDHARQGIDRHLAARDACRKDLPARRDAARELGRSAERTEPVVEELGRSFAAGSWADVSGNLDQARSILGSVEGLIARAESDASEPIQNYLRAATALAQAAADQARAERLLGAVAERHQGLLRLADQTRDQARGLEAEVRRVGSFFEENRQAVGPEARRSLEQVERAYRELTGLLSERLPDWPAIRRRVDAVRQGAGVAFKQGREDTDNFLLLNRKLEEARRRSKEIGSLLANERKDRPPANQRYRAAVSALSAIDGSIGAPNADWNRLLGRLGEIEADLDRAESLAREDISLANGAIVEISQADRAIREARAYYTSGITVDVSGAETLLARARAQLASQAYERAVDLAQSAERAAHEAYQAAAHEARMRRMRAEAGQVFSGSGVNAAILIAAAQNAARAAGEWAGSVNPGGVSIPSVRFPDSSGAGADWSSGSQQSDWTGGADQGSW
jgi:hypothetical protein